MHKKTWKYLFARSFRIHFTIDFTFNDHKSQLRKSIVKNTLLNIWPLLFTCICVIVIYFFGRKNMSMHKEKVSWKYVKIFWILEAFRRNNIMVKKICFLINDFFSFAFLYAYLQVIYGPNSKFLNTYSKYSLHFDRGGSNT